MDRPLEAAALEIHNRSPKCYEQFGDEDDGCHCVQKAREAIGAYLRTAASDYGTDYAHGFHMQAELDHLRGND